MKESNSSLSNSLNIDYGLLEKQNLIKSEIIDKNYDKNLFFSYCMNIEGSKGDNLSNWSIEELKKVIESFIKEENEKISIKNIKENEYKKNENLVESIELNMQSIPPPVKINNNNFHNIQEIKCKLLEKSILNDKNIKITIKNPKVIETGFFSSNYILYEINTEITPELNWTVFRRYSDFILLRQVLRNYFPRLFIPPIPGKKIGTRRFEVDFIDKRMFFLNKFLQDLILNETFKSSEALVSFLSNLDRNQFEMKMRELSSYIPSNIIEDNRTLNGKLIISKNDINNEKYFTNITNYFNIQDQLLDRLNYSLRNFYDQINEAVISLEDVQKDFELLNLLNNKVQMKEEIIKTYEKLGIFFKNWKKILFNQNEIIKDNIKYFFKYVKMEGKSYNELIISRDEIKNKFIYENNRLNQKKDKLFGTMDITKWEITEDIEKIDRILLMKDKNYAYSKMCTHETLICENLRKQFCYANRNNIDELRKLTNKYCEIFIKNLQEFSEKLYPTIGDCLNIWSVIASIGDKKI